MRMPFHLTLVQRVALLGTLSVVLVAVLAGAAFVQQREALRFADAQSDALPATRALLSLSARVAEHRGMSAAVLGGDASFAARRDAKQAEVGTAFDVADRALAAYVDPRVVELREGLRSDWTALAGAVAAGTVSGADSFRRHGELVVRQLKLLDEVAASSGLLLDPDAAIYALIVSTVDHQPKAAELVGQIRGTGTRMLGQQAFDPLEKLRLGAMLGAARTELDAATHTLGRAFAADPTMSARLGAPAARAREEFAKAAELVSSRIVGAERPAGGAAEFFAAMSQAIDAQAALGAASIDVVGETIGARQAGSRRTLAIVVAASAIGLAVALWMSVSMARSVRRNAAAAVVTAQALAAGDFTVRVEAGGDDEFGRIATALDEARLGIARAVRDVRDSVEAIATASTQISQGSHDLSRRTEQQAAALEQTAASMEELTGAVLQSSENARQADAMAGAASAGARAGGESMREVVATMAEISSASQRIANIVGVIDGIAFQTNILALNAAVEAARAGEQGRGFAVVAAEVRALASRSSQAAREIRTMIEASTGQVHGGERVIAEAGRGIDAVVGQAGQVSALVSAITAAAVQQNAGLAQVGDAISSLDEATQQNAALAEESAAAAESLRGQSERLATAVGAFRL